MVVSHVLMAGRAEKVLSVVTVGENTDDALLVRRDSLNAVVKGYEVAEQDVQVRLRGVVSAVE